MKAYRIAILYRYLLENTCKGHTVNADNIVEHYENEGDPYEIKAVYRDLHDLEKIEGKQLQHIGKFRLGRTVKAVKLRGAAAFCSVLIAAGFDKIPEFAAKVRGQSFHQKDDVQILSGTEDSVLRLKNQVAGGAADQDILVLEVLKVVAKYRNPFHGK